MMLVTKQQGKASINTAGLNVLKVKGNTLFPKIFQLPKKQKVTDNRSIVSIVEKYFNI